MQCCRCVGLRFGSRQGFPSSDAAVAVRNWKPTRLPRFADWSGGWSRRSCDGRERRPGDPLWQGHRWFQGRQRRVLGVGSWRGSDSLSHREIRRSSFIWDSVSSLQWDSVSRFLTSLGSCTVCFLLCCHFFSSSICSCWSSLLAVCLLRCFVSLFGLLSSSCPVLFSRCCLSPRCCLSYSPSVAVFAFPVSSLFSLSSFPRNDCWFVIRYSLYLVVVVVSLCIASRSIDSRY